MLDNLITTLYQHADAGEAQKMAQYMRHQFAFLGIRTPKRKQLCQAFFRQAKQSGQIDWQAVDKLWALPEREFQYVAADYLRLMQAYLSVDDVPRLKHLATTKSWWDTIDSLDRTIGNIEYPSNTIKQIMLEWSVADNIWLRRIAIDHQLLRKDKTDTDLLAQILLNNLHQDAFFINKAMGWALRDYSKTNPGWVSEFIHTHRDGLSKLTVAEAGKYLA